MSSWDFTSLIYEPHYLTRQSSGGLDPLAWIAIVWATLVLVGGIYLTRSSRSLSHLAVRCGYWLVTAALVGCRATGSAPLASPLWMWVSVLSGIYILGSDWLRRFAPDTPVPPFTDTWLRRGALALLTITLTWATVEYLRHRTTGVSGSDPFCYVQMAVDFARRGTFAHHFPFAAQVAAWGLPPEATLPVGYWLPGGPDAAITSYPFGFPLLLAAGYLGGGEKALWLVNPVLALIAIGATWALAQVLFREESPGRRQAIGAVAAWIVATSYTQMRLTIVPMSDVPAQLFSVLTLALALAAERKRPVLLSVLAGASLGMAYLIRHTSLILLVPLAAILTRSQPGKRDWWQRPIALGLATAFVALPDLLYHQRWLGSIWRSENPEIVQRAGLAYVGSSLAAFVEYLTYPGEFGWLLPLLLVGTYVLWRQHRAAFAVLAAWTLALAAVYAPVHTTALFQNGARYMLPAFPALALITGVGAVHILETWTPRRRVAFIVILAIAVPFILRTPLHKPLLAQYPTFGYLSPSQHTEFAALQAAIPEGAAILCGDMDSGPVYWYTGRAIVRPQGWSDHQLNRFLKLAAENDIPVYLLDDGSLETLVQQRSLQLVSQFAIGPPDHPVGNLYSVR